MATPYTNSRVRQFHPLIRIIMPTNKETPVVHHHNRRICVNCHSSMLNSSGAIGDNPWYTFRCVEDIHSLLTSSRDT